MSKNILIIFFLSIVLIVVVSGCTIFKKNTEEQTEQTETTTTTEVDTGLATNNLTDVDPTTIDATISQNYSDAKARAIEWKSDAIIATISVKFPADLAVNEANETYVFGSATETRYWFSYSVSEKTGKYIRALIPKEDYLGIDIKPINTTYWKMNYIKAFQLVEAAGGKIFRTDNKNCAITATLHHTQPKGWLWWEIEYQSAATGKELVRKVNPKDANVVDEDGNPISTSQ